MTANSMESQAVSYHVNETKRHGRVIHHHADATVPHIVALLGSKLIVHLTIVFFPSLTYSPFAGLITLRPRKS